MRSKSFSKIITGARGSRLSKAQVQEVELEMAEYTSYKLLPIYTDTTGDLDQKTSLRTLDKTNFFTKEIDELLLRGTCRIAIHSAKDLPDPLDPNLTIAAITKGVDSSDSLVFREKETLASLRAGSIVATSSERREEVVRSLRNDLKFIDLRGKIEERLRKLKTRAADAVVIAEAALIRLNLTHLSRMRLPGDTTPLQGKLAIVTKKSDQEMIDLFSKLDIRSREKRAPNEVFVSRT